MNPVKFFSLSGVHVRNLFILRRQIFYINATRRWLHSMPEYLNIHLFRIREKGSDRLVLLGALPELASVWALPPY